MVGLGSPHFFWPVTSLNLLAMLQGRDICCVAGKLCTVLLEVSWLAALTFTVWQIHVTKEDMKEGRIPDPVFVREYCVT